MPPLLDRCVYTLRDSRHLKREIAAGSGELEENKPWVTAEKLFARAQDEGHDLVVLFAAAEAVGPGAEDLVCWGRVTGLEVTQWPKGRGKTFCRYTDLARFDPPRSRAEVIVESTGAGILPDDIRPYRICLTPTFLR